MVARHREPPRLLLVAARDPTEARRGDQMRALQVARALSRDWQVTLLAPFVAHHKEQADPRLDFVETVRYRRTLGDRFIGLVGATLSGDPLQAGLYRSRDLRRQLASRAPQSQLVIVQLVRSGEALRAVLASTAARAPVLVDFIDCLSLAFERRAQVDAPWRRGALRLEARRLASAERATLERVAAAAVVCARDRDAMLVRSPRSAAGHSSDDELSAKLAVLPLGVEADTRPAASTSDRRPILVLTGNLGYFVNRDALLWFLGAVWPDLRRARPELRLVVAGARAGGLAGAVRSAGAELVADPPDLRGLVGSATVSLAPMRCGAGVPVKVLEAWAVGTPVVATSWAAAGTAAVPERDLLVADDPEGFVRQVGRLLEDRELRARVVEAGRTLLEREHSPAESADRIRAWASHAAISSGPEPRR